MSGGSFDYHYCKEPWEGLFSAVVFREMAARCRDIRERGPECLRGYDPETQEDRPMTEAEILDVEAAAVAFEALALAVDNLAERVDKYRYLMYAVEWWCSGDTGLLTVARAVQSLSGGSRDA